MAGTRRESLISAAAELLDKGGPAAVTLRAVGRAAGVSHNAPYKHFEDKDDLLAAIASRELRRVTELAGVATDGTAHTPTPQSLMVGYVRWAQRYPERFRLTFGRWVRDNVELKREAMAARAQLLSAVTTAQACGELPPGDADRFAALFLATAHGAADLALSGNLPSGGSGRIEPEDLIADLIRRLGASAPS
jgi:AcrR family transcriptional regulator